MNVLNEARWVEVRYILLANKIFQVEPDFHKAVDILRYLIQKGGDNTALKADAMIMHTLPHLQMPPVSVVLTLAKQANIKSLRPIEKLYGLTNIYMSVSRIDMDAVLPPAYSNDDREVMQAALDGYERLGGVLI